MQHYALRYKRTGKNFRKYFREPPLLEHSELHSEFIWKSKKTLIHSRNHNC